MDLEKILIVNDLPYPTAVYKTTTELFHSTGGKSGLLHMFGRESNGGDHEAVGTFLEQRPTLSFPGNNFVKYFRPKLYFQGLTRIMNQVEEKNGIIHYANQSVKPIRNSESDSVSVNDNPYSVTKTDLYSLSQARRKLTEKHYNQYSKFENVMANSEYIKKSLVDYGFSGNITVVPPPPGRSIAKLGHKADLRKKLGLPEGLKLILSVTNGVNRKNLDYVKNVVNLLGDDHALVRIGQKLGNSYTFENVTDETVNEIYNACDILLFPSLEEGFGIPLVEANMVGIPVVASDIEVFHEVAKDAAVFVNPHDVKDGARGVKEAMDSYEELVKKGVERSKTFSIERYRERVVSYFKSI